MLDTHGLSLHYTPIQTNDLPKPAEDEKLTRKNIWRRDEESGYTGPGARKDAALEMLRSWRENGA